MSKQSKHLDYDHPMVANVRAFVTLCVEQHRIDGRLVANFDQVWTMQYEGARRVLYKHESKRCSFFEKNNTPSVTKALNSIRKALSLEYDTGSTKEDVCQPVRLNAAGNLNPVDYARVPRTTTTLSWADGDLGRAFVTMAPETAYKTQLFLIVFRSYY